MSDEGTVSKAKLEELCQIIVNHANAEEAAAVDLKHRIAEFVGFKEVVVVAEETFTCLKFDKQQGSRLGEFGVADKASNIPDKFSHAYGILRANNATIKSRYYGPNYEYGYWLYGEGKIYRQKMKRAWTQKRERQQWLLILSRNVCES